MTWPSLELRFLRGKAEKESGKKTLAKQGKACSPTFFISRKYVFKQILIFTLQNPLPAYAVLAESKQRYGKDK